MKMSDICRNVRTFVMVALTMALMPAQADDTEIYQAEFDASVSGRPKVLIVFDDSGSMSFMVDQQRPTYDPDSTSYDNKFDSGRIYWSTDGSTPDVGSNNWFNANVNRCESSYASLESDGRFTTSGARRWVDSTTQEGDCSLQCPNGYQLGNYYYQFDGTPPFFIYDYNFNNYYYGPLCRQGGTYIFPTQTCDEGSEQPGTWQALSANVKAPRHVDCRDDVIEGVAGNGPDFGDGYPQDNVTTGNEYGAAPDNSLDWGNQPYTFYSSHYLDWYHDDELVQPRTRLAIAQEVITGIITTNPGIDFGLLEFNGNRNTSQNGGRVTRRIIENMTATDRTNLIDIVNNMEHSGSTPLCEATYEAYRYLAGEDVLWGGSTSTSTSYFHGQNWRDDIRSRDLLAESPTGTYQSPARDCAYTYVIIMTDGEPQNDTSANGRIETLTGKTCSSYPTAGQGITKNCLPELAEYMANTDLDDDTTNGNQYGITYTIGFTTDQELLSDTADKGKGQYYTANSAQELTEAFQGAIVSILSTDTTFTSPAVAVDTFTRTQSRDEIFYAMFRPGETIDWPGNIKKLKISITDDGAELVDSNGESAIDASTGFIKDTAVTFWSATEDGGRVERGGVGALLAGRDPATRSIFSDTGAGGALEALNSVNMNAAAFGFTTDLQLYNLFGVNDANSFNKQINWARGYDSYDQDGDGVTNEARNWILGDILHSQPLVVNYGALGSFTEEQPDLRLIVGTNAGFVHMFGSSDGQEDWAFFPKELAPILQLRRQNPLSPDNVYGMDTTAALYTLDVDKDGTIDATDGDKAWVYMGMRRGGYSLYALDVSVPDSPAFLWSVSPGVSGFEELGQSWSRPVVTRIPGYSDGNGVPKPVLVFGAGYDPAKDASGMATADSAGRGVFIVDAETGALVWSVTPRANTLKNLQETGLQHSVPAEVTVLDSNGDDLTDRIYFADAGGNVWRIDLPGNALPTASQDTWQINKLAALNGSTVATDRRFFNAPDVVRVRFDGKPIDAVLIGSGDRTNPNATDVDNRFYMIRDERVAPYASAKPTAAECAAMDPVTDFRCFLPFQDGDLFDITSNAINTGTEEQQATALTALRAANGWRLDLQNDGEKSLAKSLTLNGRVFATTFTPNDLLSDINVCEPQSGTGRLYVIDLFGGDRGVIPLGPIIPDTPSVHFGEDGQVRLLLPPGTPAGDTDGDGANDCVGGICDIGEIFRPPYGTYWFQEEY